MMQIMHQLLVRITKDNKSNDADDDDIQIIIYELEQRLIMRCSKMHKRLCVMYNED